MSPDKNAIFFLIHNTASSKTLTCLYALLTMGEFHRIFGGNLPSVDVAVSIDCVHHDNAIFLHNPAVPGINVLTAQGYNGWGKMVILSTANYHQKRDVRVWQVCCTYVIESGTLHVTQGGISNLQMSKKFYCMDGVSVTNQWRCNHD